MIQRIQNVSFTGGSKNALVEAGIKAAGGGVAKVAEEVAEAVKPELYTRDTVIFAHSPETVFDEKSVKSFISDLFTHKVEHFDPLPRSIRVKNTGYTTQNSFTPGYNDGGKAIYDAQVTKEIATA